MTVEEQAEDNTMPDMSGGEFTYPPEEDVDADSSGVTPLSMDDGKALLDYMNAFR